MKPCADRNHFGTLADGRPVLEFTIHNGNGMQLKVLNYGGIIRRWRLEEGPGAPVDIVLGFDTLRDYVCDSAYFGALIGRYANRIDGGCFTLDGRACRLTRNDGRNHLHGGSLGFHKQLWQAEASADDGAVRLTLHRFSPAGEEGYPGALLVMASYELTVSGALRCRYQAAADAATPLSISQHSYFNLAGGGDILEHELCIDADHYLPVRTDLIPTGELRAVAGGAFDFRLARHVRSGLSDDDPQLKIARGYDHNFALARHPGPHASLVDPVSGRRMEIHTDYPGLQFYSGNYLDGSLSGLGRVISAHAGLCLEPQQFPDAPNQPRFPSAICRPGTPCSSQSCYILSNWR